MRPGLCRGHSAAFKDTGQNQPDLREGDGTAGPGTIRSVLCDPKSAPRKPGSIAYDLT
ncbi:hypothetical protein ACK11Z_12295 [Methanoculleus bourgensis]|jgi:hypothetical protein|uniref:hypothetical protein n=1 Tax=Methanoculleus bourgensis TaxID=83986 RepID=UPI0026576F79|nr:hypothetical protein [Euryarchaeota archaeon]MDN5340707.1 hypothetical protein [Euryarchaeota archaeon]